LANRTTQNFVMVAQNPSSVPVQYLKVKVSHGNYNVTVYNESQNMLVSVPAEVICL
jgi:hypothetical protein